MDLSLKERTNPTIYYCVAFPSQKPKLLKKNKINVLNLFNDSQTYLNNSYISFEPLKKFILFRN